MEVPEGSSVLQAARASGLVPTDWQGPLGVAGRVVEPQQRVSAGDRVEILQPLQVDPRTRRRERAAARRPRPG